MKMPRDNVIVSLPYRPTRYTDEEILELHRFICEMSIEPPLPKAECRRLELWLQHIFYNHPHSCPGVQFSFAQLNEAFLERFSEVPSDRAIDEHATTNMLHRIFAATPKTKFRELQLTLEYDDNGRPTLRIENDPGERHRIKQYASHLAAMKPREEPNHEHQPTAAAA